MQVNTTCCFFTFHLPTKEKKQKDDLLCLTLPSTGDDYRTGEHVEGSIFETGHTSLLMLILMLSGLIITIWKMTGIIVQHTPLT